MRCSGRDVISVPLASVSVCVCVSIHTVCMCCTCVLLLLPPRPPLSFPPSAHLRIYAPPHNHPHPHRTQIDGMDFTDHVKSMRFEALLLQNILKYGAGSAPWGNPSGGGFQPQEIDDNLVEVMGMWSKTIVSGQMAMSTDSNHLVHC